MTPQENMEQLLYYLTLATKNEDDNPPQQQQDPATLPSTASSSSSLGTSSIVDQLLIQQNFTNVNLTLNQQQQLHVNNNHNSVSTNTIVMNGGQPGMANANPIELVPSGNNNSNCSVGYPTAPMINMNFNNTYMGMPQLIINPTQPVDQFTYSPNSTPSSSSSSASHDSAPQMLQTVHKKKKNSNKINKQRKMNREMISTGYNSSSVYHVGSSSSIASSSTDSPTTSSSSNMQFIHTSKEEMRIKYDSESSLNSTVAPKRKRGRPKKQEPTRPAKLDYEFIQEKGTGDSKTKK